MPTKAKKRKREPGLNVCHIVVPIYVPDEKGRPTKERWPTEKFQAWEDRLIKTFGGFSVSCERGAWLDQDSGIVCRDLNRRYVIGMKYKLIPLFWKLTRFMCWEFRQLYGFRQIGSRARIYARSKHQAEPTFEEAHKIIDSLPLALGIDENGLRERIAVKAAWDPDAPQPTPMELEEIYHDRPKSKEEEEDEEAGIQLTRELEFFSDEYEPGEDDEQLADVWSAKVTPEEKEAAMGVAKKKGWPSEWYMEVIASEEAPQPF